MHSRILWMGIYYSSFVSTILRSLRHGFCTSYMPLIPPMPWLCSFSWSFHLWPIAFFFSRRRCRRLWSIWMPVGTVGRGALSRKMLLRWCSRRVADSRQRRFQSLPPGVQAALCMDQGRTHIRPAVLRLERAGQSAEIEIRRGGHHLGGLPAVAEGVIKHREPVT